MFGIYFSDFLVKNGLITGTIPEEIMRMPYTSFIQALIEKTGMSPEDVEDKIHAFQSDGHLTDEDLDAFKSDDIEKIIPLFIHFDSTEEIEKNLVSYQKDTHVTDGELEAMMLEGETERFIPSFVMSDAGHANSFVTLALKTLLHYTGPFAIMKKAYIVPTYSFHVLACQRLKGSHSIFMGFSGGGDHLLAIARAYGGNQYDTMDDDAIDCVCELINCINGLFATEMSNEDIDLEIDLPTFYKDHKLVSNGSIMCLPLKIGDFEVEMVISIDTNIEIV